MGGEGRGGEGRGGGHGVHGPLAIINKLKTSRFLLKINIFNMSQNYTNLYCLKHPREHAPGGVITMVQITPSSRKLKMALWPQDHFLPPPPPLYPIMSMCY